MGPEDKYQAIVESLPEGIPGKMFGRKCVKASNGKAAAIFFEGEMVFKLPVNRREAAMKLKGARVFEPAPGRPMGGWIQIPWTHGEQWSALAEEALKFVAALK